MIISTTKTYFLYEKIKQQLQKTLNMFMTLKKKALILFQKHVFINKHHNIIDFFTKRHRFFYTLITLK